MIEFRHVDKLYPDPHGRDILAVRDLDLVIRDGETHALIGTSGCGKTTTLRMVNRLERADVAESVRVDGENVAGCSTSTRCVGGSATWCRAAGCSRT